MRGVISICGKGGVGKTTVSALLSRLIVERGDMKGLAIDADPGGGLSLALDLPIKKTVNDLRKDIVNSSRVGALDRVSLAASIDYQMLDSLTEYNNLAFLAVGRPEEEGCYCQVNTFLREAIQVLASQFDFTLIDAEAGVEQVNRRVMEKIDLLILVSDLSAKGIRVAETIHRVASKMSNYYRTGLVLNKVRGEEEVEQIRRYTELEVLGWLPEDDAVREFDIDGKSYLQMPETEALEAVRSLAAKLDEFIDSK